jgi:CRISPR-associated protein Cmr3
MLPQRAFVPPGTVYRFRDGATDLGRVLPNYYLRSQIPKTGETDSVTHPELKWLETLASLNYGILLWSR